MTAGTFTVQVCVIDDDGAEDCASLLVEVSTPANRYAIFAGRDDCGSGSGTAIHWSGSKTTVTGAVHSNSGLKVSGSNNRVDGVTSYRCSTHLSGSKNSFIGGVTKISEIQPWPTQLTIGDFACDIRVAGTLDLARDGAWWVGQTKTSRQLQPLTLCATEIKLIDSNVTGTVTFVAGKVQISGSDLKLQAHQHGVLAFATGTSNAIKISGSTSQWTGDLLARSGEIDLSGSNHSITGSVIGWTVKLTGSSWTISTQ